MAESLRYKTALNKAMALCSQREFCTRDIHTKLEDWGINGVDIEKILKVLIKENFINESRYASSYVRDKFKYNKWGKIKIATYLKTKGIPNDLIQTALDGIDPETYKESLRDIINRHRKSVKAKNQYDLKAKLLRYGLSKGFENWLLMDILNEAE